MAKEERITDDLTGQEIKYPFISARSLRVELSPTEYAWMGWGDVMIFKDGKNLGEWAEKRMDDIIEGADKGDY